MAKFKLHCRHPVIGGPFGLLYDNHTSALTDLHGMPVTPVERKAYPVFPIAVSADTPAGKSGNVKTLKIQLGLSCNYGCSYCLQRFVPRAPSMGRQDVEDFLSKLPNWFAGGEDGRGHGVNIQFWGGEPLVYWATLRILAEALRERYPNARPSVITNGALLTPEIVEWLDRMDFAVSVSHDGPGQAARGPDPLADPFQREQLLALYRRLRPKNKISINAMLHKDNQSWAAITDWMKVAFEDENVPLGEGLLVSAYDDGGIECSLPDAMAAAFRKSAFEEIRSGAAQHFIIVHQKIKEFVSSVTTARSAKSLGQHCGMDREDMIAVDLKGRVTTCQNVSAVAVAPNGQPHLLGTVDDLASVELRSATHWSKRHDCATCPVLQLCQGACMYVEGPHWRATCDNAYSGNIPFLAAGIEILTGLIVDRIEPLDAPLPPERQWLWQEPPTP